MRKIISLAIAAMIFVLSFIGEDVHAHPHGAADEAQSVQMHGPYSGRDSGPPEGGHSFAGSKSGQSSFDKKSEALGHDCHFCYCAFTLHLNAESGVPFRFESFDYPALISPIHSGFRSETIRPPASVS